MGMHVTQYTDAKYIGFVTRDAAFRVVVCRKEETAKKLRHPGCPIVKINAADHCSLGELDSNAVVRFTEADQSHAQLAAVLHDVSTDDEGYAFSASSLESQTWIYE